MAATCSGFLGISFLGVSLIYSQLAGSLVCATLNYDFVSEFCNPRSTAVLRAWANGSELLRAGGAPVVFFDRLDFLSSTRRAANPFIIANPVVAV